MAILKNNQFGALSGKLGNIVFRQHLGKTIVSARPIAFNDPKTPEQINLRQKFSVCAKLASAINKHSLLLPIWKLNTPRNKSAYQFIIKNNIGLVGPVIPGKSCVISPPHGFPIAIKKILSTSSELTFRLPPISEFTPVEKPKFELHIAALICWHNPADPAYIPFALEPLSRKLPDYNSEDDLTININFNKCEPEFRDTYRKKRIFLTLCFYDTPLPRHSITLSL